ncbi:MAG: isocitrate lyase/phosphoenolpyruvate mutase family protein [Gammaproteobacteria bacterium]|jgi:2-methylisocitrate lyase-like PEP mutase family enzyme
MNAHQTRCQEFRELHRQCNGWIIPNPWDVGSARLLAALGFKALATTSAGLAFSLGKVDGAVTMTEMVAHCSALTAAARVPVNADFENGYAENLKQMVANITQLAATGVAGISIEDFSRDRQVIYPLTQATERVHAAAEAIAATGLPIMLTARAESLLRGGDEIDNVIERLQAYEKAGADVLYAPAIRSLDTLRTVTGSLNRPFNVLASFLPGESLATLAAAGANRVSVGSALTYAAMAPLLEAGREMLVQGTFSWMEKAPGGADIRYLLDS